MAVPSYPDVGDLPAAALEVAYSPSSRAGGSAEPFVAEWATRSADVSDALGGRVRRLPDGSRLVVGEAQRPLLIFVHGGYWQALSAEASMFLAAGAAARGWSYAAVEYPLAPGAAVGEMVDCTSRALEIVTDASRSGGHRGPVVLAGHSAGAHLVAMSTLERPSAWPLDAIVLLGGIFDLRPLVATTVNDALHLDRGSAAALSPLVVGRGALASPPVLVAWASADTDAFIGQSRAYAARLADRGATVEVLECAQRHHFDVVDDLVDPSTELGRWLVAIG